MWKTTAVATLLVAGAFGGTVSATDVDLATGVRASGTLATDNVAPLADAGLDQEVTRGATVLLDGTGSRDPDGRIERHSWSITTPGGETITPDCHDCARTEFTPSETGRYRVTLTVTDDGGATRSDTLYVDVSPGAPPSVSLSGSRQLAAGTTGTYTADLSPGGAPLEYVVWTVDGTVVANHSLSASQETDTATKRFPTAGDRSISATVHDADGRTATETLSVTVQQTEQPDRSDQGSSGTTIAGRHDPTVTGDSLVTGTEPLRGHYDIRLDAAATSVESIEWRNASGRIDRGHTLTKTWEPGDHQVYAVVTYVDDSENVATFPDGTTTVTADPKPNVSVRDLDRYGAILGTAVGTDAYENLDTLRVEVDGETIATAGSTLRGRHMLGFDRQRSVHFSYDDFTPGEHYSVTVIATDDRGQTTEVNRELVPVKEPEIVRSEFVNDPVDSYHERIDSSRYAAHHVLEIDLNGVDPENVSVDTKPGNDVGIYENREYNNKNTTDGRLVVQSYWKSSIIGTHEVDAGYELRNKEMWWNEKTSKFEVTPSKPELRLDVLNDGTKDYITREHGILVDASDSFDPDGTDLKYIWKYGAEPTKPDNTTAKFRAYERASSIVEDEYDLQTEENLDFLSYFVPDIEETIVSTDGPYFPDETVRVRVETNPYHLSKQTYYDDFSLGVTVSDSEAEVLEWNQVEAPDSAHSKATEDAYRYEAVIEIPASALSPGTESPSITVYNEENTRKTAEIDFPDVNVLVEDRTYWDDVTVTNLTYLVERPDISEVTADSPQERDKYLGRGYAIDETKRETEYALENKVKVRDAKYEQVTERFDSKRMRNLFINSRSNWYRSGTTQEEVTRTETTTDWHDAATVNSNSRWHDSDLSNGEYTGRSREKLVNEPVYQTQWQYEYDYEVEKTGTRTVTRVGTVSVPRTGTRTTTECRIQFGCRTYTETYTYYTTKTYTYTTTKSYTYTVTRTNTYWAAADLATGHTPTGKTRQVKVEDAVYETQKEVKHENKYTDTVTRYIAGHDRLIEPAQYEWQMARSTTDAMLARQQAALNDDWRIGERTTDRSWVLTKQDGTTQSIESQYRNESRVVETSATIEGKFIYRYHNIETGEKASRTIEERSKRETFQGAKGREELIDGMVAPERNDRECKIKNIC